MRVGCDFVAFARFPYPEGVTVNPDKADAALDRTTIPAAAPQSLEAIRRVRNLTHLARISLP